MNINFEKEKKVCSIIQLWDVFSLENGASYNIITLNFKVYI